MNENKGVIYVLTNPSFPEYVKIGYAENIDNRLKSLNRSECIPFAFRVYATYEVNTKLSDLKVHTMIDLMNPSLRTIDNIDGKKRVREFYAITAHDAYEMLKAMAEIHGTTDNLKLIDPTESEITEEETATEERVKRKSIRKPYLNHLIDLGIVKIGEELYFKKSPKLTATLLSDKTVNFNGEEMTYMNLGREVTSMKSFSYYDQACRCGSAKTLGEERHDYMIDNNIPVDEDFNG
ncbi:MAG: GIY-YIG nuclease family protein [bacterium]